MVKDKYGIGIIGFGGFGTFIKNAWNQMDNAYVSAVCDADESRNPGDVNFYKSVEEFLKDPSIDIVSIATPPSSHKDLAIAAMKAGKHVLIEKPLALSEADGKKILAAAKEYKKVATVNFVLRFNPIVDILKKITDNEVFGKLRRVDLRNYAMQETVPEGHWFWNPEISGRILIEHGVHFFDLASYIGNTKAKEAWSLGVDRKEGMEDRVFAVVKYDNDVVGSFWHSFSRPRELETTTFHFAFDLAEIDMVGWIPLALNVWGWTNDKGVEILEELCGEVDAEKSEIKKTVSSEYNYEVGNQIGFTLEMEEPKLEVYAESLKLIMGDVIEAIENPSHKMLVTLNDALEAVKTAEKATKVAHP